MLSIQSLESSAAYQVPQTRTTSQPPSGPVTKPDALAGVGVSSAAVSFPGLGDVILSNASGNGPDGDETTSGTEINDGDADDLPAGSPTLSVAEDGTYSVGIHA